jgi:hypothetical protein
MGDPYLLPLSSTPIFLGMKGGKDFEEKRATSKN